METRTTTVLRAGTGDSSDAIMRAVSALRRGALVIMPTDTVYGVAAAPEFQERLYEAKGRDRHKPVPLLAAGLPEIERHGAVLSEAERRLAERFWPGPLTLVLKVDAAGEGFRVPDHEVALAVLREFGGVLRVTSANLSGEPPALSVEDAISALAGHVELALDAGASPGGVPSTVAKVEHGAVTILRQGALGKEELENACRNG